MLDFKQCLHSDTDSVWFGTQPKGTSSCPKAVFIEGGKTFKNTRKTANSGTVRGKGAMMSMMFMRKI